MLTRGDDEAIARNFVQPFFNGNAFQVSIAELRETVRALDGCPDDVPEDPKEFCVWVRRELLELEHLPREKLAELYRWATDDLQSLEKTIAFCDAQIEEIKSRPAKRDSDPVEARFFEHYRKENQSAKNEIIDTLTHHMQTEALRAAFGNPFGFLSSLSLFQHHPWSYRDRPERLDPRGYSPVQHMLLDLRVRKFRRAKQLYQEDRLQEFDEILEQHLEDSDPVAETTRLLDRHHLLSARKTVLLPALNAYHRGELELFSNVVAVQIEGLIEDACILSDVPLEQTRLATIVGKLDALAADPEVNIDYTYFAYKFPTLRNRIAHGRMIADDRTRTSRMLLLDLRYCCRLVHSHPGPRNAIVKFLQGTRSYLATVGECLEFAVLYAHTAGASPDDFYSLNRQFNDFKLLLEHDAIWKFVDQLLLAKREELDPGIRLLATSLRTLRPALRSSCGRILQALGERGKEVFEPSEFFRVVRNQLGHEFQIHSNEATLSVFINLLRARMAQGLATNEASP